jgi:hypothetical protein
MVWFLSFFGKSSDKIKVSLTSDKNISALRQEQQTFVITFRSVRLRTVNVPDKVVEKIKTHILFSIFFFSKIDRLWDNLKIYIVEPGRSQMTIWRMHIAFWIYKATKKLRICHKYCCSSAAMVECKRLSVTLYVRCQSCYNHYHSLPYRI